MRQTGRSGFDAMPWMPDGKVLWEFIKPFNPTLLSQLPDENWARCMPEKCLWAVRNLGHDVQVIVVMKSHGKGCYAAPGYALIDDDPHAHKAGWEAAGGTFVHHVNARSTISALKAIIK